mgnify:CR=1 FL=1
MQRKSLKSLSDKELNETESIKLGFDNLSESENFVYNSDQTKKLKRRAKKIMRNPETKKYLFRMIARFDDKNFGFQKTPETY